MKLNVKIEDKPILDLLEHLEDPQEALMSAGNGVKAVLQDHYFEKNESEPNKLGANRSNWWADVARSVRGPIADGRQVRVEITKEGLRQKIKGGTIRAKRHKNLAIPIHPDAYGLFVRPFEREMGIDLQYVEFNGSKFFGAEIGGKFTLFYYLTEQVTQKPWPNSLPSNQKINQAAKDGAIEVLLSALQEATT